MARVVTKPKGPPYLLIIFIFLFLLATTLMVLAYNQGQEWKKQLDDERTANAKLASDSNKRQGDIADWMRSKDPITVIERLTAERKKLIDIVVGPSGGSSVDDVETKVKAARALINSSQPLVNEIEGLKSMIDERDGRIKTIEGEREERKAQADKFEAQAIALAKKVEDMGEAFAKEKAELSKKADALQQAHDTKVGEIEKTWSSAREELNKTIATLTEKSTKMDSANKTLQTKVGELERKIEELKPKKAPTIALMPQPDGKIVKVLEGQNLCYINLGSMDRVIPGLTFSVYAPTGIPEDGEGKASVTVTEVNEAISLCRIDRQKPSDPIIANDLVANIVYDANKAFTFVVEGQFDLFGTGQPTAAGAEEIKTLVRKHNGKLADVVTAQTDFVLMGAEPPKPPKPADAASEQAKKVYDDQLKEWKHYQDVRALASGMQIPILNTNRFLALIGYNQVKK